jgi:hypothetical protein
VQHKVEEFFVSDVASDELYVSATVWAELEVEVEYYGRRSTLRSSHLPRWFSRSDLRDEDEDGDEYLRDERRTATCECIYPCVRMQVQLDVADKALKGALINSMEIE